MAISTAPVVSDQIFLADLNSEVKKMEGECEPKDKAWVIVRQAKESDQQRISELTAETRTIWRDNATEQVQDVNPARVRALQVYLCLEDAGNIFADSKKKTPLFEFRNGLVDGGFSKFNELYGALHPQAARAMSLAVLQINPQWDWTVLQKAACPDCGNKFVITDSVLVPLGEAD